MFGGATTPNILGMSGPLTSAMSPTSRMPGQSLQSRLQTIPPTATNSIQYHQQPHRNVGQIPAEFSHSIVPSQNMQSAPMGPPPRTQSFTPAQVYPQVSSPHAQNFQRSSPAPLPGMLGQQVSQGGSSMSGTIPQVSRSYGQQHAHMSQPNTGFRSPYQPQHQPSNPQYNSFMASTNIQHMHHNAPTPPSVPPSPPAAMSARPFSNISQLPDQQYNNFQNTQHHIQGYTPIPTVSTQMNSSATSTAVNPVHLNQQNTPLYADPTQVGQNKTQSYSNNQQPPAMVQVAYESQSQNYQLRTTPQIQPGVQLQPQNLPHGTTLQQPPAVQVSRVAIMYTQPASVQSSNYIYSQPSNLPPVQTTPSYQISGGYPSASQQMPNMNVAAVVDPNQYGVTVSIGGVQQQMGSHPAAVNCHMQQVPQQVPGHVVYSSNNALPPFQAQSAPSLLNQNSYQHQQQMPSVSQVQQHGGQPIQSQTHQHYFGNNQVQVSQQYPTVASPTPSVVSQNPNSHKLQYTYLPQAQSLQQQQVQPQNPVHSLPQQIMLQQSFQTVPQQPAQVVPQQQGPILSQQPVQTVPPQTVNTIPQHLGQSSLQQPILSQQSVRMMPQHQAQSIPPQQIPPSQQQQIQPVPVQQVQPTYQFQAQHQVMSSMAQSISGIANTTETSRLAANSQVQPLQYASHPGLTAYVNQMPASQNQPLESGPQISQNQQPSQSYQTTQQSYLQQNFQAPNPNRQSSYSQQVVTSSGYVGQKSTLYSNESQNFQSQQSYVYRSQPHPGSYFSAPSNENSPKHVPVQQNIPRPPHKNVSTNSTEAINIAQDPPKVLCDF